MQNGGLTSYFWLSQIKKVYLIGIDVSRGLTM